MKELVSKNLIKLAQVFADNDSRLYVVGGWVRNNLCGLALGDIDICGSLHDSALEKVCIEVGFKSKVINEKLGTYVIIAGTEKYEYTPFRVENYNLGKHAPESVEWTDDIKVDAKRRDFTCNAIYYDILADQIIDFYDGVNDIKRGVLRTVETPEFVFSSDGLRILRLVRFACQLGWKIDRHTLKVAKNMTYQLKFISGERKTAELKSIFTAQQKYGRKSRPLKLLNDLSIYPQLVPLASISKTICEKQFASITQCNNTMSAFICALLLSKYARVTTDEQIAFDVQNVLSSLRCGGDAKELSKTISVLNSVKQNKIDLSAVCKFVALKEDSKQIVSEFYGLDRLLEKQKYYEEHNIPLRISDLKIENSQIIDLVPNDRVSYVKAYLFDLCQNGLLQNQTDVLVEFIKRTNDYATKMASKPRQKPILKGIKSK